MDEFEAARHRYQALRDAARRDGRALFEIADLYDQGSQMLAAGDQLIRASTGSFAPGQSPYPAQAHAWVISQEPLLDRAEQALRRIDGDVVSLSSQATASVVSGTTMVSGMATSMVSVGIQLPQALPQFDRAAKQRRIDDRLRDLAGDDRLGQRHRGAWEAYRLGTREGRVQACHTMRDIVMLLFDHYAKQSDVRGASWWRPAVPERDPSRRDQLRYFILGPNEGPLDPEHLETVDRQVAQALDTYTKACQIAHDRYDVAESSLWAALTSLEDSIDLLFEERETVRYLRALAR